jgi:hypothetical protein
VQCSRHVKSIIHFDTTLYMCDPIHRNSRGPKTRGQSAKHADQPCGPQDGVTIPSEYGCRQRTSRQSCLRGTSEHHARRTKGGTCVCVCVCVNMFVICDHTHERGTSIHPLTHAPQHTHIHTHTQANKQRRHRANETFAMPIQHNNGTCGECICVCVSECASICMHSSECVCL